MIVDSREPKEIQEKLKKDFPDLKVEMLAVGDIVSGPLVIERKTNKDFIQSLLDRRLWVQSRMMAENFGERYLMIIGDLKDAAFLRKNPLRVYYSALGSIVAINQKFGVHTISLPALSDYFYVVKRLLIETEGKERLDYRIRKKARTVEEIRRDMLCALDKISVSKAKTILSKFPTITVLTQASVKDLREIPGIGKKLSKKIKEVLG